MDPHTDREPARGPRLGGGDCSLLEEQSGDDEAGGQDRREEERKPHRPDDLAPWQGCRSVTRRVGAGGGARRSRKADSAGSTRTMQAPAMAQVGRQPNATIAAATTTGRRASAP